MTVTMTTPPENRERMRGFEPDEEDFRELRVELAQRGIKITPVPEAQSIRFVPLDAVDVQLRQWMKRHQERLFQYATWEASDIHVFMTAPETGSDEIICCASESANLHPLGLNEDGTMVKRYEKDQPGKFQWCVVYRSSEMLLLTTVPLSMARELHQMKRVGLLPRINDTLIVTKLKAVPS